METKKGPAKVLFTANPWTLTEYPSANEEWDLRRKLEFFADAGCTAVTVDAADKGAVQELRALSLRLCGFFMESNGQSLDRQYLTQIDAGAETINCFLGSPETPFEEAVAFLGRLHELETRHGIPCHVETHRATMTENPEFTIRLFEEARQRFGAWPRVAWDHSHLAVVKHFGFAELEPWLARFNRGLIAASRQLHLRPFNGHHAQIPVTNTGDGETPEFAEWLTFAQNRLQEWTGEHDSADELWLVPELGPVCHGYGLSSFPDVTEQLRHLLQRLSSALNETGNFSDR